MRKTNALTALCLLLLISSCGNQSTLPPRPPYEGHTWGDMATYLKQLEDLYDGMAKKS